MVPLSTMTTTSTAPPISNTYKSSNPFAPFLTRSSSNYDVNFAPQDISADLAQDEDEFEARSEGEGYNTQLAQSHPARPPFMTERHRSSSDSNLSSSSSSRSHGYFRQKLHRKPAPPPPRPIFPPPAEQDTSTTRIPAYAPPANSRPERGEEKRTSREELERQEKVLLQRAIEESKRDSVGSQRKNDEDAQLQRALEASRLEEQKRPRTPPMSSREAQELERALALSTNEPQYNYLARSSKTPSPIKHSRSRSVSNPEGLPPFPFTQEDLVRPSYPKEKSHLFPQGLPSLPPGAGSTNDEYEREMEMLTLAIRMSEEEERLRQEREERELREVVKKVEARESALMGSSNGKPPVPRRPSPPQSVETTSPTTSPRQKRSSWFRPPLASKYSTATSPPASPPLSPESTHRPGLEATPTDSTIRSGATSFRSAAESLPFSNLVPTTQPHNTSQQAHPPQPRRQPPPPPQPNRLPPSPPETPVVGNTSFSSPSTAPPIPPLPSSYSRSRQGTADSDLSDLAQPSAPFVSAHSEAFRLANDGSPVEMPYLTPSASNSIRSAYRGSDGRVASWALDERNGSNNSGSGSGSASGHSRGNSVNRRSAEVNGEGVSGVSPDRSEEGGDEGRRSYEEGDEGELNSMRLAIRNPDSSPAPPIEFQHQGRFVGEPSSVDVPRDIEGSEPLYSAEPGEGIIFESAYAGRSMSAIDEATEPASSIIAEENYDRQGSYPSTLGTMDSTVHHAVPEDDEEGGGGGEDMERSITYHARPMEEREWMHESVLRRSSQPPITSSSTPTLPASDSPTSFDYQGKPQLPPPIDRGTIHARQMTASTESSAGNRLSFPLPPFNSTLPPTASSPIDSVATTALPIEQIGSSGLTSQATSTRQQQNAFADGTRFGHPSICARDPGHACPDDGLDGAEREVPEMIELTALMDDPIGLGFNGDTARRREETGGKSILRDAWAVEARNWGSLLRFLMWYGDTKLVASSQDIALEPTRHCTAAASLEFRPDDEGYTIIRLVVAILAPDDPDSHAHRELTVEHPNLTPPGKGKGKARSYFQSSPSVPHDHSTLATFHLPDSVHLPCRLSGLAIQLYTLRHLASIARSTMPAKEGAAPGYHALRELSAALEGLTAVAAGRQQRDTASSQALPNYGNQSGGGGGNRADENERLLTRLRDRLRRLKRGSTTNENNNTSPTKPNKLVKAPPRERGQTLGGGGDSPIIARAAQPLARTERVLSANDHDHDQEEERLEGGSGNHVEVDRERFSMVQREPPTSTRRERIPEEWQRRNDNNNQFQNETSYLPSLSMRQ